MYYFNRKAIERINADLMLPYDNIQQDWDIELADSGRINEFIAYAENYQLSEEEQFAIVALILSSYDELLNNDTSDDFSGRELKH